MTSASDASGALAKSGTDSTALACLRSSLRFFLSSAFCFLFRSRCILANVFLFLAISFSFVMVARDEPN